MGNCVESPGLPQGNKAKGAANGMIHIIYIYVYVYIYNMGTCTHGKVGLNLFWWGLSSNLTHYGRGSHRWYFIFCGWKNMVILYIFGDRKVNHFNIGSIWNYQRVNPANFPFLGRSVIWVFQWAMITRVLRSFFTSIEETGFENQCLPVIEWFS